MARSAGLRIGPRRFELVVLDGSAKKHKVVASFAGEFPRPGPDQADADPIALAAGVLRDALKQHNVPHDNVGIAIDSGQAAFRLIKMPFSDRGKIEAVLKFEVESLLPQWNIDDVVVDFHILESTEDSSELLVTAVQKVELRKVLTLCEKAGLEPLEAELETTAMVNAALAANLCTIDTAQVLVHVGEHSTSVVVVDGGKTREMRAIHFGALSHEVVQPSDKDGEDGDKAEKKDDKDATGPQTGTWLDAPPDPDELQRRLEQTIKRIRRELARTVSASRTAHPIESILVCGLEVAGLVDSTILDLPVKRLDPGVEGVPAGLDGANLVVAYGVALRQIGGGVLKPSLRREELRYTGAFERVELPLAVVCLLLVTLLGVWNIFLHKETLVVDAKIGTWRNRSIEYLMGNPKAGLPAVLRYPSEPVKKYTASLDEDTDRTKFEQIKQVKFLLDQEVRKYEKDLGQDAEFTQPQSALTALVLVLDVMSNAGGEQGRVSLRKLRATYQNGRQQKPDKVRLSLDFSILADNQLAATHVLERFQTDLASKPWVVPNSAEAKSADPLENSKGISVENMTVEVDVSKAPKSEARVPQ